MHYYIHDYLIFLCLLLVKQKPRSNFMYVRCPILEYIFKPNIKDLNREMGPIVLYKGSYLFHNYLALYNGKSKKKDWVCLNLQYYLRKDYLLFHIFVWIQEIWHLHHRNVFHNCKQIPVYSKWIHQCVFHKDYLTLFLVYW